MKFCNKCEKAVLEYEADVVTLDELQTEFALVIKCTICDSLIQYKQIIHEKSTIGVESQTPQYISIPAKL